MLNQFLLAAQLWVSQTPSVALRANFMPSSKLLSMLRGLRSWLTAK